jgi:putative ABC transport system permease protein
MNSVGRRWSLVIRRDMSNRDLLSMVWSNLNRMRARVTLTAVGVMIGTAAVLVLISLGAGLQRSTTEQFSNLGDLTQITVFPAAFLRALSFGQSSQAGRPEGAILDDKALASFRKMPHVVVVTPEVSLQSAFQLSINQATGFAQITGVDPGVVDKLGWQTRSGVARISTGQAVIGARVGENFADPRRRRPLGQIELQGRSLTLDLIKFSEEGQRTTRRVRIRVAGVLKETGGQADNSIYLPLRDVVQMNEWATGQRANLGKTGYPQVLIKVDESQNVLAIANQLEAMGYLPISLQTTLQGLNIFFGVIQGILGGIGAIALIVAAFGIANTMTMAIFERTREIGIMKALGATNRDVMRVFLGEASAIGLLGGVGGVVIGLLLSKGIDFFIVFYLSNQPRADTSQAPQSILFTPLWLIVFDVVFATGVGLISGVYPAIRAASMKPLVALRYE